MSNDLSYGKGGRLLVRLMCLEFHFDFLVLIFHGFALQFSSKLLSGTDWESVLINHILPLGYTKGSLWGSEGYLPLI